MDRSERLILIQIILLVGGSLLIGLLLFFQFHFILDNLIKIRDSDVVGAIGTIYALISAFILSNVWSNFKETEQAVSQQNEAIITLWNSADYFDSLKESNRMRASLVAYINSVLRDELIHSRRFESSLPGKEFLGIQRLIDSIKLVSGRDEIVFSSIISTYETLSIARNKRINRMAESMPQMLRVFYVIASIILWGGFAFEGFQNPLLYLTVNFSVTTIIVLNYFIIIDFDNPLDGFIRVSFDRYLVSRDYILHATHTTHT